MAGVGRKSVEGTYRTPRTPYRTVDAVDAGGVDSVSEEIDITLDPTPNPVTTGANASLFIYAGLDGPTAATLQLFAEATDETTEGSSSSGAGGNWVYYGEHAVDVKGLLWVIQPLPAGKYKVVVSAKTGNGDVIIKESHSA